MAASAPAPAPALASASASVSAPSLTLHVEGDRLGGEGIKVQEFDANASHWSDAHDSSSLMVCSSGLGNATLCACRGWSYIRVRVFQPAVHNALPVLVFLLAAVGMGSMLACPPALGQHRALRLVHLWRALLRLC